MVIKNLKIKIISVAILLLLFAGFFTGGIFLGKKMVYQVPQPDTIDFSLFWDAYNKLQQSYVEPAKIDSQKILYGAIEGMANSLGDPYTSFFNPADAKRFEQDLAGSFDGIGAEIGIKKDQLIIISPIEGMPAQKSGLRAGDVILKIDGKDAYSMTTDEAVNLIRGPKGSEVVLNVYREGWEDSKDIKMIRATIKIPSMKWSMKSENVAYVQIFQFDQPLAYDFYATAVEILNSPAEKIVLDLRNNPGGYLEVAQYLAGFFLEKGKTVTIEDFGKNREQQIYKSEGGAELAKYPIVILINEGSASASEILAGALRDNTGVKLVGAKSFGKGSVQEVISLQGGSFLKVTIAKWLTPKGVSISDVGLNPDVKVEISDLDIENKKDPQLDKALEIIKDLK